MSEVFASFLIGFVLAVIAVANLTDVAVVKNSPDGMFITHENKVYLLKEIDLKETP